METFTQPRDILDNPRFKEQRQEYLSRLDLGTIDAPIVELVRAFAKLPYCFTLQSCYGHFIYRGQRDPNNVDPLPEKGGNGKVKYRIAYIAVCVEDSDRGRRLLDDLSDFPAIDPEYVQFGCAGWFRERQVNTYVLQVEPERHATKDTATVSYGEALHIEKVRNEFFERLARLVRERLEEIESARATGP